MINLKNVTANYGENYKELILKFIDRHNKLDKIVTSFIILKLNNKLQDKTVSRLIYDIDNKISFKMNLEQFKELRNKTTGKTLKTFKKYLKEL